MDMRASVSAEPGSESLLTNPGEAEEDDSRKVSTTRINCIAIKGMTEATSDTPKSRIELKEYLKFLLKGEEKVEVLA
ncbi:unnamed protein product [Dibothriocephalus latus]|uniref:Uncharacterized protein n=1 Tax=Dibothriocephalus latus TaxID=60516 RepID=A0A3P7NYI5_DIBLA|nr:unnamed protein product [Dibothriocephalus latus]